MAVQTQIQVRRGTASSWTSTNPTLAAGEIGFESDTGKIKVGTGSATWNSLTYIGAANAIQYVYNASAGQTTFSGADANGATLSYTVGAEQVYVNGVLQVRGTDYTATNGTSVVLTTATIASDIVTVIAYGTFTVADTYTQAQANATFPLNTSAFFAGKNKIINGDFGIWQRGVGPFTTSAYSADRWTFYGQGTGTGHSATQQTFTPGTAPVSGYEGTYFYQDVITSGSDSNTQLILLQKIEDVRQFAGQTVTISFWAKATSGTPKIGTEFYQDFGSGGSGAVTGTGQSATISTSWSRYSFTHNIPSIAGKTIGTGSALFANIWFSAGSTWNTRSGSIGLQSNTFQIWGVQVEAGSVATAFQTATGTIQGELAACQRYYWRSTVGSGYGYFQGGGNATNTTTARMIIQTPVQMRIAPTAIEYSGALAASDGTNLYTTGSWAVDGSSNPLAIQVVYTHGTGSLTQYRFYCLQSNNNTSTYIGFSAEL